MLATANRSSHASSSSFYLLGLPGLESIQVWIAIPFCLAYTMALLGNSTLLWVITTESRLHKPMFLFLCLLAFTDIALPTCTLPKMLSVLWAGVHEITFNGCLVQMFLIHMLCVVESGTLTAMAYDRYVAICSPLTYASLLSRSTVVKLSTAICARALVTVLPIPLLVKRLSFCRSHLISHSYCEHMAVVKVACGDTIPNNLYGLILSLSIVGGDLAFIFISYGLILRAVFCLPSLEARHKALGTCGAHVGVIIILYTPGLFSFLTHRFGHSVPQHIHIFLANFYLVVPAMLNPIIYGAKTKEIRERVLRALPRARRSYLPWRG